MRKLEGLKPEKVFRYFEDISAIPRGSGKEEAVSRYCLDFARERGLAAWRDEHNNVVITKPATKGYEAVPGMILQGHLDMVWEKDEDCEKDFEKEGIDLVVDGDFVRAEGTTLGGDDGIAVAMMLAILDDETIVHPRLECVFTTEEETGLYGAEALDCSRLTGRRMINIDSRREGVFTVSCAGGVGCGCMLPLTWEEIEENSCTLWVEGLKGGHSGSDIHRELGNSNMLMGRLLYSLTEKLDFRLGETAGGMADNAIPHSTDSPQHPCGALCARGGRGKARRACPGDGRRLQKGIRGKRSGRDRPPGAEWPQEGARAGSRERQALPASFAQRAKRRDPQQHGHQRSGADLPELRNPADG